VPEPAPWPGGFLAPLEADMVDLDEVEATLHRIYIRADGTSLRKEDLKKSREILAFLREIDACLGKGTKGRPLTVVDAAAGKAYVGLLAAELVLVPRQQRARVTFIERDEKQAAGCRRAIAALASPGIDFTVAQSDVDSPAAWPEWPDLVVALHACGPASDSIIDRAIASQCRHLLLVPCCTSAKVRAAELAVARADALGLPRHAEIRRRFIQSIVDAERTLRLEAAGYQTTVVPFVPPTVTPHNLLWRSQRVGEAGRMRQAAADWQRLRGL
jgi:hypothetical protein